MTRQQRRKKSWKVLKSYSTWEEGINFIHALRKKGIRCFVHAASRTSNVIYIHPQDELNAKQYECE